MRRTPLVRRTRLESQSELKRGGRLAPISKRRRAVLSVYRAFRQAVRERAGGQCELGTPDCVRIGSEVQHLKGRIGPLVTDMTWARWTCRPCHRYAHAHPAEAYERGWMVRRTGGTT